MFCKYCGKKLDDSAEFCNSCGKRLDDSSTPLEQIDIENDDQNKKGIIELFKENYAKATKEVDEKNKKEMIENIQNTLGKYLKPKDGNKHVIIISNENVFKSDSKYYNTNNTLQVEFTMEMIQKEGYEILDVKTENIQESSHTTRIDTLIIYK